MPLGSSYVSDTNAVFTRPNPCRRVALLRKNAETEKNFFYQSRHLSSSSNRSNCFADKAFRFPQRRLLAAAAVSGSQCWRSPPHRARHWSPRQCLARDLSRPRCRWCTEPAERQRAPTNFSSQCRTALSQIPHISREPLCSSLRNTSVRRFGHCFHTSDQTRISIKAGQRSGCPCQLSLRSHGSVTRTLWLSSWHLSQLQSKRASR